MRGIIPQNLPVIDRTAMPAVSRPEKEKRA